MTSKSDFTEDEWKTVASGPTNAGMIVITASRGGTFRETFSMAKAYTEAREQHGQSELLDAIVSAKPVMEHGKRESAEELRAAALQRIRDAVALVEQKGTPDELDAYRRFTTALADRVANAHSEHGEAVSPAERTAMGEIGDALGAS